MMLVLRASLLAIAVLFGMVHSQTALQSTPKAPTIVNSSLRGSGCESGSVKLTSAQLGTFVFSAFRALLGPDGSSADAAQICMMQLQFEDIPSGYAMVVKNLVVRGHLHLDPGSQVVLQTLPYWAGSKDKFDQQDSFSATSSTALDKDFQVVFAAAKAKSTTSGCDPTRFTQPFLNINVQVAMTGKRGIFDIDSLDVSTELIKCP